jgi:hypothetical protein
MITDRLIKIPNPCSENWNKMNKTKNGRFCESCNQVVIDFTKMKDEKIKSYFEINQSNDICGNYKKSQVYNPTEEYSFKNKLLKINFRPLNLILLMMSFFVSSCMMGKRVELKPIDTKIAKDTLSKKSNKNKNPKDSVHKKS